MTALLAAAAVTTAHAGTAIHDAENDAFTATLKCHDANGELYMLNFSATGFPSRPTRMKPSDSCGMNAVQVPIPQIIGWR